MNFIYRFWNLFFEKLYTFSLRQMNFGSASHYRVNGELHSLKQLAQKWKNENVTLFDVGANVGEFTLEILEAFKGQQFQLYVFEPSHHASAKLREKVPVLSNVHLVQKALGAEEGTADLFSPKEGSALGSLHQRDLRHYNVSFPPAEKIAITTLDDFCSENKIDRVHLLKIDVEGHELAVLKGAAQMIERNAVEAIQFEFGGTSLDSRTYFKDFFLLLSPKYRIYRILPKGLRELPGYTEKLEIFLSANYLAIAKH